MRLPIFIVGLFLSVALSALIGFLAGFKTSQLVLFVIAVAIVLQLAYVLIVALLAVERKRKTRDADGEVPTAPPSPVSQETDA
ncbi:hypothetical protein [Ruegeria sp. HKCCD8929]|uniref:hypothetical protein n=1 Tax=Ruegeria sp. HKCCD8929 TaxID=2683006 RepID=UPI0014888ED2|nr:hypothetical protein [Ruegeria sp. HKCCD8929]